MPMWTLRSSSRCTLVTKLAGNVTVRQNALERSQLSSPGVPPREDLHVAHGTEQADDADLPSEADAADLGLLQKAGEPKACCRPPLRALQFLPRSQYTESYPCDGSRNHRPCLEFRRAACLLKTISWNRSNRAMNRSHKITSVNIIIRIRLAQQI